MKSLNSTEFFQSLGCVGTVEFLFLLYLQALSYCVWFNVLFSTGVLVYFFSLLSLGLSLYSAICTDLYVS